MLLSEDSSVCVFIHSPGSSQTLGSLYEHQAVRAPGKSLRVSGLHCYLQQLREHKRHQCVFKYKKKKKGTNLGWKVRFPTIQAVDADYEMDAFFTAFIFLQAEVGHSGCQLGYLTIQEARQPKLFHFFLGFNEPA